MRAIGRTEIAQTTLGHPAVVYRGRPLRANSSARRYDHVDQEAQRDRKHLEPSTSVSMALSRECD